MQELEIKVLEKHLQGVKKELEIGLEYARQTQDYYIEKFGTHRRINEMTIELINQDIDNMLDTLSWVKTYLGEEDDYVS